VEQSLEMYEEYLRDNDDIIEMLEELNGIKELGCWCNLL